MSFNNISYLRCLDQLLEARWTNSTPECYHRSNCQARAMWEPQKASQSSSPLNGFHLDMLTNSTKGIPIESHGYVFHTYILRIYLLSNYLTTLEYRSWEKLIHNVKSESICLSICPKGFSLYHFLAPLQSHEACRFNAGLSVKNPDFKLSKNHLTYL